MAIINKLCLILVALRYKISHLYFILHKILVIPHYYIIFAFISIDEHFAPYAQNACVITTSSSSPLTHPFSSSLPLSRLKLLIPFPLSLSRPCRCQLYSCAWNLIDKQFTQPQFNGKLINKCHKWVEKRVQHLDNDELKWEGVKMWVE